MKLTKYILALVFLSKLASAATVNIQISQGANQATNFANAAGSASNGLVWGLMISSSDNVFSALPENFQLSNNLGGSLIPTTDDYFISSSIFTSQGTTADSGNFGKINIMNGIVISVPATNALVPGNRFAIVWFDSTVTSSTQALAGGTQYGLLTNSTFVLPAAAGTTNVSSFFSASPDPVKTANTFTVPTASVPEPSAALLGMLGALGLLRRRR